MDLLVSASHRFVPNTYVTLNLILNAVVFFFPENNSDFRVLKICGSGEIVPEEVYQLDEILYIHAVVLNLFYVHVTCAFLFFYIYLI